MKPKGDETTMTETTTKPARRPSRQIVRKKRPLVIRANRPDQNNQEPLTELAILEQARALGWDLLDLLFTNGTIPADRQPDGAIIGYLPDEPLAIKLRQMGCPAVRLARWMHPDDHLLPTVMRDEVAVGRLAAEHFAERQFRHVAFVGHSPWPMERTPLYVDAFKNRAHELGIEYHLYRLKNPGSESPEAKYNRRSHEVGQWLSGLPKPLGLLAYSDIWGATLCTICRQARLAVPEAVAVLGISNNLLRCEMAPVGLSSIDVAMDEWGRQAALLLDQLMRGKTIASRTLIRPHGVVVRQSTDVLAVDDPVVAKAMRFMWDHLEQDLPVEAVAHEVGVQRRQLERAFQYHLKRGIHAELRRKRLERCCELLRTTRLTIADIAPQTGFRSADFLHATFKQEFGITPRRYRLKTEDKRESRKRESRKQKAEISLASFARTRIPLP